MKLTHETQDNMRKAGDISEVLGMPGWTHIYAMAMDKIMDLQSINNLDDADANTLILDLKARRMASTTILDFLKEINAFALNNNAVRQSYENDSVSDSYIERA